MVPGLHHLCARPVRKPLKQKSSTCTTRLLFTSRHIIRITAYHVLLSHSAPRVCRHTLYEDSKENDNTLEVIYVSSDNDAEQKARYMQKKHGGWLSIPFADSAARDNLKKKYGCFAGKEAGSFPGVKRRAGIPSIVIISPTGDELVHMDCDPPTEINRKGDAILDEWMQHKWP